MISVPCGTGDISFDMICTIVDDICSAYDGTDIISYLLRKYIIRLCRINILIMNFAMRLKYIVRKT